jgi:hypothetical protein
LTASSSHEFFSIIFPHKNHPKRFSKNKKTIYDNDRIIFTNSNQMMTLCNQHEDATTNIVEVLANKAIDMATATRMAQYNESNQTNFNKNDNKNDNIK